MSKNKKKLEQKRKKEVQGKPSNSIRKEYYDIDYMDQLNPEEKKWMKQFMEEYLNASFQKNKKPIHTSKDKQEAKRLRKSCYDMNNARNRCIQSRAKARRQLDRLDYLYDDPVNMLNDDPSEDDWN